MSWLSSSDSVFQRAVRAARSKSILSLLLFAFAAIPGSAQTTTASLLGTVMDTSGATVSDVVVKASNLATNYQRETTSDQNGNYSIQQLPAGEYRLTATKTGFQVQQINKVSLLVR